MAIGICVENACIERVITVVERSLVIVEKASVVESLRHFSIFTAVNENKVLTWGALAQLLEKEGLMVEPWAVRVLDNSSITESEIGYTDTPGGLCQ